MFTLRPVWGEGFLDREELVAEMVETLSSPAQRVGFALTGKRRMGKTSISAEFARAMAKSSFEAFQECGALSLKVKAKNLIAAPGLDPIRPGISRWLARKAEDLGL